MWTIARAEPAKRKAVAEADVQESGVYVSVRDGEVSVGNSAGTLLLAAGQFGFVASNNILPKLLPGDPGLGVIPQSSLVETVTSGGKNRGICD
jgi:hypothetical protein